MPRILVIDDEKLVALMIRRALEGAHEVVLEHSAAGALSRLQKGERYDAVIADLHLTDGSAMSIRDELARAEPALASRLLVLTGGADTARESAFLREPGVRWLQKPFRGAELIASLGEVLAGSVTSKA